MSDCARLADRLFDDDVGDALKSDSPPPADLRSHLRDCDVCQHLWASAQEEITIIGASLVEQASARLSRRVAADLCSQFPIPRSSLDWGAALSWSAAGGSMMVAAALLGFIELTTSWRLLLFVLGAWTAFTAEVLCEGLRATDA